VPIDKTKPFLLGLAAVVGLVAFSAWAVGHAPDHVREMITEEKHPHLLPTFRGDYPPHHAPPHPGPQAVMPDTRDLFERALACWPVESLFRAEIRAEGRLRNDAGPYYDGNGLASGGRSSVAIVATIPLYSGVERDREREREWIRRTKVADEVGLFITALATRDKSQRMLEITRALERRSQERVKIGVAPTMEQVGFLEKVASIEGDLVKQYGDLQKARLSLLGLCTTDRVDQLDDYLVALIDRKGRR
jgi:hypothetical protein